MRNLDCISINKEIKTSDDIQNMEMDLKTMRDNNQFIDNLILTLSIKKNLYYESIECIKKYTFGTDQMLSTIYLELLNYKDIYIFQNTISNFINPVLNLKITNEMKYLIEILHEYISLAETKCFPLFIKFDLYEVEDFQYAISLTDKIKSYYFDKEINIVYSFKNKNKLMEEMLFNNIEYLNDTLNYRGYNETYYIEEIRYWLKTVEFNKEYKEFQLELDKEFIHKIKKLNENISSQLMNKNNDIVRDSMSSYVKA